MRDYYSLPKTKLKHFLLINSPNIFSFKETAITKIEDSEENSGSGTTEAVESEESGSSEESGESEESGNWEESGESGESGDYEDSEESGDSNISKRDEIPKEQGQCTENSCFSHSDQLQELYQLFV